MRQEGAAHHLIEAVLPGGVPIEAAPIGVVHTEEVRTEEVHTEAVPIVAVRQEGIMEIMMIIPGKTHWKMCWARCQEAFTAIPILIRMTKAGILNVSSMGAEQR